MSIARRFMPPLVATLLIAGAMPAFAQSARAPTPRRDWADHYLTRVDTEKKGYITLADAERFATAQFARLDRNHDGTVDHTEFLASAQRSVDRANPVRKARAEASLEKRETLFHTLDQAGDGKITQDEYLAATRQHFAEIDTQKTGKLTADDLRAAHRGL